MYTHKRNQSSLLTKSRVQDMEHFNLYTLKLEYARLSEQIALVINHSKSQIQVYSDVTGGLRERNGKVQTEQ